MIEYGVIAKEGQWFVATALPSGVTSQGETVETARANLQEALELYYEDAEQPAQGFEPMLAPLEVKNKRG